MPQQISPLLAAKAGNSSQLAVSRQMDPVYLAKMRWNDELVLNVGTPTGSAPPQDGVPYTVAGAPQPFCWPNVKVSTRAGFLPGPDVRFVPKDDGMHLVVVFEEDKDKRLPGTLPFEVKITAVTLVYGPAAGDVLDFPQPLPEPKDPAIGPAFTIEADAPVPADERRGRIVAALQTAGAARWTVAMEFQWVQTITTTTGGTTTPPPKHWPVGWPAGHLHMMTAMAPAAALHTDAAPTPPSHAGVAVLDRPTLLIGILKAPPPPTTHTTTSLQTLPFTRTIRAEYPDNTAENHPIFAAITGNYTQAGWQNTAHGWFQPTPLQDTVYTLPTAYRLQVDAVTGQPSIQAVLLRKADAGNVTDSLDPKFYTVRLTLKVRPDFDAAQLDALRTLIRAQSSSTILFADLVLGGYSGARFVPDPALAGLGDLFAGTTAAANDAINPEDGFTVTYQGNAEFIDLLFQRLKGEGIGGTVELDLQEPGGTIRKQTVPVVLTLRQLAAVPLPWKFAAQSGGAGNAADTLPTDIVLDNPMTVAVGLDGVQGHALQKSPVTGHVEEVYDATPDGTWPATLAAGASTQIHLSIKGDKPLYNAWDVSLVNSHVTTTADLVLGGIFDAATSGVRGWQVTVDCPPLQFFDQLSADDQARFKDVVALEVEVRRKGSDVTEEARLTRAAPSGQVLLSRTVADFVSDRAVGRSTFEYRQRTIRITRADEFTDWKDETGSAFSVFFA